MKQLFLPVRWLYRAFVLFLFSITLNYFSLAQARTETIFPPGFTSELVAKGLNSPTDIAWLPDGSLLIAEQGGRVRAFQSGVLLDRDFIDLSDQVNAYWERGLLGIAVHPDFPQAPYVYLAYVYDPPGVVKDGNGQRVSRLARVSVDPQNMSVAVPGSETILLGAQSTRENIAGEEMSSREAGPAACEREGELVNDCLPAESYTHAIGSIAFGDDGSLFVGNGEGARANALDPRALRAQNIDSLGGKILRINPLNGNGYPDNPFYDGDPTHDRSKVWSYGLRNPYTFALHPSIQEVFIGDVGWKTWEEINIGSRGKNFGWPCYEGDRTHSAIQTSYQSSAETQRQCAVVYALGPDAVQDPLYAYHHSKIGAAIVVGSFYQGHAYPSQYQGALFFTDFVEDWIRYLVFDPSTGQARTQDFAVHVSPEGNLTRIKSGPDGDLYYLVYNGEASEVRRIHYDANRTPL